MVNVVSLGEKKEKSFPSKKKNRPVEKQGRQGRKRTTWSVNQKKMASAGKSEGMNNHIQQRCLFSNKGMISTLYKSFVFGWSDLGRDTF